MIFKKQTFCHDTAGQKGERERDIDSKSSISDILWNG